MYDVLFYISLPLLLTAGLMIKNKSVCCFYCGAVLFIASVFYSYDFFYSVYPSLSQDMSAHNNLLSPGFIFLGQVLSGIVPEGILGAVIYSLLTTYGIMSYINRFSCSPSVSAVMLIMSGIFLMNFINPYLYAGMIIALHAFRYASEMRFVRFAAVIMLAACFDLRLLAILPLYILIIIKPTVYHIPAAAIIGGILIFFDASPFFSLFLGYSSERTPSDLFIPITILVFGIISALMIKFLIRRGDYIKSMLTLSAVSSALAIGAISDSRFLIIAFICFCPVVLTLTPEITDIFSSVISLTFKEKKKPVLFIGGLLLMTGLSVYYYNIIKTADFVYIPFLTR